MRNNADLLQGSCGSSTQADMNFPQIRVENGGNQKANFVRNNNAEGSRKTLRDLFELSV